MIEADKKLNAVEMFISIVSATKEATAMYISTISREISFKETQAKSRF